MNEEEYAFTVLPYIHVTKPFKFGEFVIWPDTDSNWKKYLRDKRPSKLLDIYVDKQCKIIPNKTIVTSSKSFDFERTKQLISTLFYIPSIRHFFRFNSETFYFESFFTKKHGQDDSSHTRIDKFVRSLVASKDFKIYQSYEADYSNFELKDSEADYFQKLRKMYVDSKYQYVIKSLTFYFRTQYRNNSLFPEIEDIQNFCTAFEILFQVKADNDIGKVIAGELYKYFSLADTTEREELKRWFVELYKIRSDYTHGNNIDDSRLVFNNQRHIDIAKQVYCEAIKKYLKPKRGPGKLILSSDKELLIALFSSRKVFDSIVKILTNSWNKGNSTGKDNLLYLKQCKQEELGSLLSLSYKFVLYVNKKAIGNVNSKRVKTAMQTILSMLDDMIVTYSDPKSEKEFNVSIIQTLKTIPLYPKNEQEWEQVYQTLNNPHLEYTKYTGNLDDISTVVFKRELSFRDIIDISMLTHVFTDLYYIYKNWHTI